MLRRRGSIERKIFETLAEHVSLSSQAVEIVVKELTVSKENKHEIEFWATQVIALEKKGDDIVSNLAKDLGQSTLPPTLYGQFHLLADVVDDILDELYFIAQEVSRGRKADLDENDVVCEIYRDLASMLGIAKLALDRLSYLFRIILHNVEEARSLNQEIDIYEDRVDELRNNIVDKIYLKRSHLDPLALYHLLELTKAIDRVVDSCEDAAHLALSVASFMVG